MTRLVDHTQNDLVLREVSDSSNNRVFRWSPVSSSSSKELGVSDGEITSLEESKISLNAREILKSYDNRDQVNQALSLLRKLDNLVTNYGDLQLPPLQISSSEDNSTIGITWNIADAIMGISIPPDKNESSWFLLEGEDSRGITAYGNFSKSKDEDLLFRWLLFLIERL